MIQFLVLKWLRWRYGGDFYALKPPIGWNCYFGPKPRLIRRIAYWFSYRFWRFENWLFARYGAPMRHNWERAFLPREHWRNAEVRTNESK